MYENMFMNRLFMKLDVSQKDDLVNIYIYIYINVYVCVYM
jgi:hypothetical protein